MDYIKQLKVLVVEPAPYLGGIIRDALENGLGVHSVTLCRNPAAGRNLLAEARLNLLIVKVDADCPEGVPLIDSIRRQIPNIPRDLPIIAMTGAPTRQLVERLRDLGVNEILALPLTGKALAERVQSVFEHPRDWVVSANYVGPDRRRKTSIHYKGGERRDGETAEDNATVMPQPVTESAAPQKNSD